MKRNILILVLTIFLVGPSCKKTCSSNGFGCNCPEWRMTIEVNDEDELLNSFTEQEMDNFYLIRTDINYVVIDSLKMNFGHIVGNVDYNRIYAIHQSTFPNFENLKEYHLLIKNHLLNSVDTVADIDYTETMETKICNNGCDESSIDCISFSDNSLEFNGVFQDSFSVRVLK